MATKYWGWIGNKVICFVNCEDTDLWNRLEHYSCWQLVISLGFETKPLLSLKSLSTDPLALWAMACCFWLLVCIHSFLYPLIHAAWFISIDYSIFSFLLEMKYVSHDKHGCATLSEQTKLVSYTDIKDINVKSMKFTLVPVLILQIKHLINIPMVDFILTFT